MMIHLHYGVVYYSKIKRYKIGCNNSFKDYVYAIYFVYQCMEQLSRTPRTKHKRQ